MPRCTGTVLPIDRRAEVKKAVDGLANFLRDRQRGKKLVAIFGLPLVGKTFLGKQICDRVLELFRSSNISHRFITASFNNLTNSYVIKDYSLSICIPNLGALKEQFIRNPSVTFLVFLDEISDPDLIDKLLTNRNCCFVLATRKRIHLTKWGPRVQYLKLSPLNTEKTKDYMCKHLKPADWTYRLNEIARNCQGFPRLLSAVTDALLRQSVVPEEIYKHSFLQLCRKFLSEDEAEMCSKFWTQVKSVDGVVPEVYIPSLVIMQGSFGTQDVAALSKMPTRATAKRALIEPLFSLGIVSRSDERGDDNFIISDIIQTLLEERYGYLQNNSDLQNRFCRYFAKIFSDLETKMITDTDEFFSIFLRVYPNLLALVERAVYCLKEEYDVLINVGRQAELIIMGFLQAKEVVTFYEACASAAKERGNKTDYARMLSALGHCLLVICPDVEAAGERIWEAYDMMKKDPNILPTDIALTTSHKGHYCYLRGDAATSVRYYEEALSIYRKCYDELPTHDADDAKVRFLKLCLVRMRNNIAISVGCLGQHDYSIKLHKENIVTYQEVFKSNLGLGKAYHCIGLMLHLKGDEEGALKYSRIGLDIKRRSHSKRPSLSIIYSMSLVGTSYFYSDCRDVERALLYLDDALAMIDDLKRNHADRSLLLNSKGTIYLGTGNYVEAEKMFKAAAEIRLKEFGIGANCCTGEALQYLGETYYHLGDLGRAVATLRKCLFMEMQYYRQSPKAFEATILKTLEWLSKSLVAARAERSLIEFVDRFVRKMGVLMDALKAGAGSEACMSFQSEVDAIVEEAYTELDLHGFHAILPQK